MPLIISAMRHHGVGRLVFMSSFGVGSTRPLVPFLPRLFAKTLLRDIYEDKAEGEQLIKGTELEWTLVYPAGSAPSIVPILQPNERPESPDRL